MLRPSALERYGFAVVAVGAALLYKLLLGDFVDAPVPFLLFPLAVLASAWRGGWGPGLFAAAASLFAARYFFLAPPYALGPAEPGQALRLGLFAAEVAAIAAIGARAHNALRIADAPARAKAEVELRARAERLLRLMETGPVAVIGMDEKGAITSWSPQATKLFGWSEEDVRGRDLAGLVAPPAEREAWRAERERFRRTGDGAPTGRRDLRLLRRGRDAVRVDALVTAARAEGGAWEFTFFLQDVTDRAQADELLRRDREREWEEELGRERQARQAAETETRVRDEFMATLSHELRTPLSAIVGWAHLLRSGSLDAADQARAVETIDRSAKAQAQLIADIFDVSAIITGKLRLAPEPVRLAPVVEAAAETVRPAATAKNIRVEVRVEDAAARVSGDANRLQQIVWNLATNAVKFTPRGGVVHVRLGSGEGQALLEVRDQGRGIRPDFLPHVFDRYRQAGDEGEGDPGGGLGLGLAIVSHLVELHGGTVRAESAGEGQGATFTVSLPLLAPEEEPAPHPEHAEGAGAPSLEGVRVLVVDDDADVRGMMETVLAERGAQVTAAATAGEALDSIARGAPDVLLSDLSMPEMDGYALLRELRGRKETPRIPAAAVTAYARAEDRRQALLAGFQMHVAKPIEPDELVAVVASLAGKTGPAGT